MITNSLQKHKDYKIGVWGLGRHSINNIIPAINNVEKLILYGVFSRNKKNVNKCCEEWNCKTWKSLDEMLSDSDLDIIYLSTPPGLHYEQGRKVLESNKHLWCEKPFTMELDNSEKLIKLAKDKKLSICESFMYLYHPQFLKIKNFIDDHKLGNPKSIHFRFGLPKLDKPGFRFNKKLGGSCLFDVGCYPVSGLLSLMPNAKVAILKTLINFDNSNSIDVNGSAFLKIGSDTNCFMEWAYDRSYRNDIDIWFDKGNLYSEKIFSKDLKYKPSLELRDLYGNLSAIKIDSANHFEAMLESFLNSIGNTNKMSNNRKEIFNQSALLEKIKYFKN
jgi:NDP-hexose-3-ketoreductase